MLILQVASHKRKGKIGSRCNPAVVRVFKYRGIVHPGDRQRDRGYIALLFPVIGPVSEGVGAVVVEGGQVAERSVAVQREGTLGRLREKDRREWIPVRIRVIDEHAGGTDCE